MPGCNLYRRHEKRNESYGMICKRYLELGFCRWRWCKSLFLLL